MFDALPQSIAPSGSSWFSGTPVILNVMSDFIDHADAYLGEAVSAAEVQLTAALRQAATEIEEWAPYADQLGVKWSDTDGGFVYYWEGTPEHIDYFKSLEYGRTFGSVPKSVTRKVAIRMEDRAGKLIQQILEEELGLA